MITVYGIKNCDTVKKALKWLTEQGIEHRLHDYRVDGLNAEWLAQTEAQFGWENLVNKRSTTWRNLDENIKQNLNRETALATLLAQPTLIRRPLILQGDKGLIGFDASAWTSYFQS